MSKQPTEDSEMTILLSTGVFKTTPLAPLFPHIRSAGFRYLEVADRDDFDDGVLDELSRTADSCGIGLPNWHLVQESPFRKTEEECEAAIARVMRSMDRGRRLGARNHVVHWDHRFRDRRMDQLWRAIIDRYVEYASASGIRLLMETVPDKPSNERYVPTSEVFDFVRSYPSEVLSICVDVNHSNLRESLPAVVESAGDRLVSLHISDNDGTEERHWLPGQGVIDYPPLFRSLDAMHFSGALVIEVNPWCASPGHPEELRRLYDFAATLTETGSPHPGTPRPR